MNSTIPNRVVERLVANMRTQGKDVKREIHSRPVSDYLDPARHALEVRKLFHELPIVVAHSSQLPAAGDFITHDKLGLPLIVVRRKDGGVAAFRNICSHRAATVETAACGNRNSFMCPYHNWTFGLDGTLLHIPDGASFAGEDTAHLGLKPVAVAEKYGLIFVRVADGPAIDIDAYLGDLAPELERLRIADHTFFSDRDTPLKCNWKVMLEGSLETYHIGFLHAAKLGKQFAPMACVFDDFYPHQCHTMPKKNLLERIDQGGDPRRSILPTWCIFPNTMLTLPHDHMTLTQVFPVGVDNCVFYNSLLTLEESQSKDAREYWDKALTLTEGVNDEDFAVLEGIQRSHEKIPGERVIHGRYELGVTRFHRAVDRVLAGDLDGSWGRFLPND